jgi:hypothetical protein
VVVRDQGSGDGGSGLAVVPDRSGHREDALGDPDSDALEGPAAVSFQVELAFEGVVDRFDELADLLEHRLAVAGLLPLAGRPQQLDALLGEVLLESLAREAALRELTACDRKLARHRAALEAGADPALVATWTRDVQAERRITEGKLAQLDHRNGTGRRMTKEEIRALVQTLGGLVNVLRHADPADKGEVYRQLGLSLTYDDHTETVLAETRPTSSVGLVFVSEGGLEPPRPIKGTSTSS